MYLKIKIKEYFLKNSVWTYSIESFLKKNEEIQLFQEVKKINSYKKRKKMPKILNFIDRNRVSRFAIFTISRGPSNLGDIFYEI